MTYHQGTLLLPLHILPPRVLLPHNVAVIVLLTADTVASSYPTSTSPHESLPPYDLGSLSSSHYFAEKCQERQNKKQSLQIVTDYAATKP